MKGEGRRARGARRSYRGRGRLCRVVLGTGDGRWDWDEDGGSGAGGGAEGDAGALA